MRIDIRPDPSKPMGGYARLDLEPAPDTGEASVAVRNVFSGQYLGEDGWQPTRAAFGPYPVVTGEDGAHLIVGPEIVNQIEEYTPVELHVGEASVQTSWPDDVAPAPGAARLGGITAASTQRGAEPEKALRAPQRVEEVAEEPGESVEPDPVTPPTPPPPERGSRVPVLIGALLVLLGIAAALAYLFLFPDEPEPEPEPEPVVEVAPDPEPEPAPSDPCSAEAVGQLSDGPFTEIRARLEECSGSMSPDTALAMVEQAADAGDGAALSLFGQLYDGEETAASIEDEIGLTFASNDPIAAEYYHRAVEAGASEAEPLLAATCERLAGDGSDLARSAREDYCQ
ncbi:hypothetical protein E0K89_021990 [Aquicoccus sp. SCR17]|nr:hypothetical protein [Carideicomes alvinocaridis]